MPPPPIKPTDNGLAVFGGPATSLPGFTIAKSRDRAEFIRMVDRKFKGTAGHRTVLVTGALELPVEPLKTVFGDGVAAGMEVTDQGVLTGYLATSPVAEEAQANGLHEIAQKKRWRVVEW